MTAGPAAPPPGWHGKLPSLGDFASRRLPPDFLAAWDGWLAAGLQQLRERDPAGWLDAYLATPTRRFLLMPGVLPGALPGDLGAQAWAGVLMPSVDRVGRYFPFTLVQAIPPLRAGPTQLQSLWHWLGRLDELAADALQDDWAIDRLEAELARMAGPALGGGGGDGGGDGGDNSGDNSGGNNGGNNGNSSGASASGSHSAGHGSGGSGGSMAPADGPVALPPTPGAMSAVALPESGDIAQHIGAQAQALWWAQSQGLAFWYTHTDMQPPSLRVSRGLPATAADLLGATI